MRGDDHEESEGSFRTESCGLSRKKLIATIKACGYRRAKVAAALGLKGYQVASRMNAMGVNLLPRLNLHTDEEIEAAFFKGRSYRGAGMVLGVHHQAVRRAVESRPSLAHLRNTVNGVRGASILDGMSREVLAGFYEDCGFSWPAVAKRLGVYVSTVTRYVESIGAQDITKQGVSPFPWTKELLEDLYWKKGYSMSQIASGMAKRYRRSCAITTVSKAMKRFGVKARPSPLIDKSTPVDRGHRKKKPPAPIPGRQLSDDALDAEPLKPDARGDRRARRV